MTIKALIKTQLGTDLPISGGDGWSLEDAIILHHNQHYDAIRLEYTIMHSLACIQKQPFEFVEQLLLENGDRQYDRIEVKMITPMDRVQHRYFYFDITDCFKAF